MSEKRRIVPPVYLLGTLLVMAGLHYVAPLAVWVVTPLSYAGGALIVLGVAVAGVAAGAFKRVGTPVIPFEPSTALVTGGLYRVSRNPMYLGMVLVLLGTAIGLGTVGPLLPIPVFVWLITRNFIVAEEEFLEGIFGADYLAYKATVRRWI